MRTTLTLDPDVAVLIEEARDKTKRSLKEIVNEALRRGLSAEDPSARGKPYRTPRVDLGDCRLADLDDIAGVLAAAEGDHFR
jgi:hypothetical protein